MLINEDYFKDINLTDDDITATNNTDSLDSDSQKRRYYDENSLNDYILSKYKYSLIIKTVMTKNLFSNIRMWETIFPNILKKLNYIFDFYNIEHEYIIRDVSQSFNRKLNFHKIYDLEVVSYCNEEFFKKDYITSAYIMFFVNLPEMSYKNQYWLIDRIVSAVFRNNKSFVDSLFISDNPVMTLWNPSSTEHKGQILAHYTDFDDVVSFTLPYKKFFMTGLTSLQKTDEEREKVYLMYDDIERGIDPFSKK